MFVDVTNLRETFLTLWVGIYDCVATIIHCKKSLSFSLLSSEFVDDSDLSRAFFHTKFSVR